MVKEPELGQKKVSKMGNWSSPNTANIPSGEKYEGESDGIHKWSRNTN